jgi:hypothetical protein
VTAGAATGFGRALEATSAGEGPCLVVSLTSIVAFSSMPAHKKTLQSSLGQKGMRTNLG